MNSDIFQLKASRWIVNGFSIFSICVGLVINSTVQAESSSHNDADAFWKLFAKPRICVLPSDRRQCIMDTDITWSGSVAADICLLSSQETEAMQCWYKSQDGHLFQTIASETPITLWLSPFGEDQVLTQTQIRIVHIPPRRIRRRRRHIWSLL